MQKIKFAYMAVKVSAWERLKKTTQRLTECLNSRSLYKGSELRLIEEKVSLIENGYDCDWCCSARAQDTIHPLSRIFKRTIRRRKRERASQAEPIPKDLREDIKGKMGEGMLPIDSLIFIASLYCVYMEEKIWLQCYGSMLILLRLLDKKMHSRIITSCL